MWSYLYLAGYVGRIRRERDTGPTFEDLARANRAREEDRRLGPVRTRTAHGASGRAPHLRIVRYKDTDRGH